MQIDEEYALSLLDELWREKVRVEIREVWRIAHEEVKEGNFRSGMELALEEMQERLFPGETI